jgi:hypothetical protein
MSPNACVSEVMHYILVNRCKYVLTALEFPSILGELTGDPGYMNFTFNFKLKINIFDFMDKYKR